MPRAFTAQGRRLSALARIEPASWRREIRAALHKHRGNVAAAARSLGLQRRHLWRWIAKEPALLEGSGHVPRVRPAKVEGAPAKASAASRDTSPE